MIQGMHGLKIGMEFVNMPAFLHGLTESDKLAARYMRQEMIRGTKRIRKMFINEQLKGPPGIHATGRLSKGKNIFTKVWGTGGNLNGLVGISSLLNVHEQGVTIDAHNDTGLLFLQKRGGGTGAGIFATKKQVVIPKRLHFRELVEREAPKVLEKVAQAGKRGIEQAMSNALKKTIKGL